MTSDERRNGLMLVGGVLLAYAAFSYLSRGSTPAPKPKPKPPAPPPPSPPPPTPPPPQQPPAPPAARTVTVCPWPNWCGSLWGIAQQMTGNGARWPELYALNVGIIGSDPNLIYSGTVLRVPATW